MTVIAEARPAIKEDQAQRKLRIVRDETQTGGNGPEGPRLASIAPPQDECAVSGCRYTPVDNRGPVSLGKQYFRVCTPHWEAILSIVGEQVIRGGDGAA